MMADSPEVLSFRVGEMERNLREMRGEWRESIGQLGGGLTALQTQLSSYQSQTADRFVPRRDFDNRQREIDERFKELTLTKNNDSTRMWLAASAIGTLLSASAAVAAWLHALGH